MGSLKIPPLEMVFGETSSLFDEFLVNGNHQISMSATLTNKDGKRFDDFSSLVLDWESSDQVSSLTTYVFPAPPTLRLFSQNIASFLPSTDGNPNNRILSIHTDKGSFNVRVSISGYNKESLKKIIST